MIRVAEKVLITGASGLIGSHLCGLLLSKGRKVRILIRENSNLNRLQAVMKFYFPKEENPIHQVEICKGDVTDYFSLLEALEGIHVVYHCAGLVDFDDSNYKELHRINADGTANVVNACLEMKISLLQHVSSVAVFSDPEDGIVSEKSHWKSSRENSAYAVSKYNAEREVWRGKEEGLNVIVTNPVLVVGPGCIGEGSGALVTQAKKKFPFYTSGSTGFVDVRDVVRAMYLIEEKEIYNQRFILCGENLSFLNAFSFFNTAFSHRPPGFLIPKLVLWILSRIESFLHLFFSFKRRLTKSAIRSACSEKRYSSEKFLSQVDFNFTGIEKSIVDTCQFYKDFQKLS